ncbi:MAG TPA: acylneuraminate cytidylyltransferase family protein, partial [Nitrospirales bacterium]|nr:acylneuraminate cytidylyltransferase family protein [Nitrospirales bacterium]
VDGRRYGTENSRPHILPPERAVNVDTEFDFLVAEKCLEQSPRTYIQRVC